VDGMSETFAIPVSRPGDADDKTAIAAAIHAETQAFMDEDFEAWARCWVQDERTTEICVNARIGLSVISGWQEIAARMKHVLQNNLGCRMARFSQGNLRITVDEQIAWAVYDGWVENQDGATWETFETRILERGDNGWKIVYSSFVEHHNDDIHKDTLCVDRDGRLIWASPETLQKVKQHPILTVSAGRVRARRRDWDRALQDAIAQAGRYHGFYMRRRFAEETGGPMRFPAVLGETDEGGVAVVHVSVGDSSTYLQFDGDGSLDRRLSVAQAVFGLSDGQLRIARHISGGMGLTSCRRQGRRRVPLRASYRMARSSEQIKGARKRLTQRQAGDRRRCQPPPSFHRQVHRSRPSTPDGRRA